MNNEKRKRGRPSGTSKYEAYVKEYNQVEAEMKKRGYKMKEKMYSKAEWEEYYESEREGRLEAIAEGKRKTTGNINRDLVKEQTYSLSTAQAKAQRRYLEQLDPESEEYKKILEKNGGKAPTLLDIRGRKVQIVNWQAVSDRNDELRQQGYSWDDVHKTISQEFFGS